jgi:hypothetical protein
VEEELEADLRVLRKPQGPRDWKMAIPEKKSFSVNIIFCYSITLTLFQLMNNFKKCL